MKVRIHRLITTGVWLGLLSGAFARAPRPEPFSVLVVPERVNVVQVSMDVLARRPVALVAYRKTPDTGQLVLNGWVGDRWVEIAPEEYSDGSFLVRSADRVILVGDDLLLPPELVAASGWAPMVVSIDTTDTDELLNSLGRLYAFTPSEWRWFAQRYNMALEDVSPPRDTVSWYDRMTAARQQPPRRQAGPPPSRTRIEPVPVLPGDPQDWTPEQEVPQDPPARQRPPGADAVRPAVDHDAFTK